MVTLERSGFDVPGMDSGLNPSDPTIVAAFRSALLHQGGIALAIVVFLLLLWATARTWRAAAPAATGKPAAREVPARRLLRIGFGLIWILDGLLQAQPKMAAGLPSLVIAPTAAGSPAWVQ